MEHAVLGYVILPDRAAALGPLVERHVRIGTHRTLKQDLEFGVAQLVEIALRGSTKASARIWHAEQLVEPTEPERGLGDYGALLDPLPKRPPRMHRKTYLAICAEIEAATELALGALAAQMIALQRRVEPLLERIHPKTEEPRAL